MTREDEGSPVQFDLRSDTVTRPTARMREAIASAAVGDDVYREDATVTELESEVARILGKEAALFVPSGTMANQIALLCHTRPGDEVIVGRGAHCAFYESGAGGALAGVQFEQSDGPLLRPGDVEAALKPRAYYCPRTSLVALENTHNRGGGIVYEASDVAAIAEVARSHGLALHLDGARLWNAAAAQGCAIDELARPFDTVSVCFSKGLGAPIGSALVGPAPVIEEALRFRKMLGGGMRQVGMIAAGALFALRHQRERLVDDHRAAARLGDTLAAIDGVEVRPVVTNIVLADVSVDASEVVAAAARRGVAFYPFGPRQLRLVTHLDVSGVGFDDCVEKTREAFAEAVGGG